MTCLKRVLSQAKAESKFKSIKGNVTGSVTGSAPWTAANGWEPQVSGPDVDYMHVLENRAQMRTIQVLTHKSSTHSSSLSKPGAIITHNATQAPTVLFNTHVLPVAVRWWEGSGRGSRPRFHYKVVWSEIPRTPSSLSVKDLREDWTGKQSTFLKWWE